VTDDRFVLVLDQADAQFDAEKVESLLRPFHLVGLDEQVVSAGEHQ
jgi:hypothetical protein